MSVDPQLKGAGQQKGNEIWRIVKFGLEKVPKEQHGCFYVGDSYIILHTSAPGAWSVHYWLGDETTTDEQCTAAIKTVELDDALGGGPVQYREIQGHESAQFLSYFKEGIRYLNGGVASGLHHGPRQSFEDSKPRLFQCKGKRNVRCTEVPCSQSSLNLGDVFILDCGLDLYVWMPPESGHLERIRAQEQALSIRDVERAGRANIHTLDQDWDTNEDFWLKLGGKGDLELPSAAAAGDDKNYWKPSKDRLTLWSVSDESGRMEVAKVSEGNFKSSQLDSKSAFILDTVNGGIFVWIGKHCSMDERRKAMQWAQQFVEQQGKPAWTQIVRVLEGAEPAIFTQWASFWEGDVRTPLYRPRLFHCSDESGHLAVEEIARFSQKDLDDDDVMILDALDTVYVWIGGKANRGEEKYAEQTAKKYLAASAIPRPEEAVVKTINQGAEPPDFKKYFKNWH